MKSIRLAHIVVVADKNCGLVLAARLRRMQVGRVTAVGGCDEARRVCLTSGADACIVPFDDAVPDAAPMAENDAPGCASGVPSLMVVTTVTPYLRKMARRGGYLAAVPAGMPSRMLYRRIGAALQKAADCPPQAPDACGRRHGSRPVWPAGCSWQADIALIELFMPRMRC